jgi:hypothetical protein
MIENRLMMILMRIQKRTLVDLEDRVDRVDQEDHLGGLEMLKKTTKGPKCHRATLPISDLPKDHSTDLHRQDRHQ